MNPRPATRRLLPFAFPALLAGGLAIWVATQSKDTATPAAATVGTAKDRGTLVARHVQERLAAAERAARNLPIRAEAPSNPIVAELFERFGQGDRKVTQESIRQLAGRPLGKQVTFQAAGIEWSGTLDSRLEQEGILHLGIALADEMGRFQLSLRDDNRILASVLFNGESQALACKGFPENGAWTMEPTLVEKLLCTPAGSVYPVAREQAAMPRMQPDANARSNRGPQQAPPILNSKPESTYVLYCDFDGEVVTHPIWNDGQTINAAPHPRANDVEFVTLVWRRSAEDFAPFDINVTTDRAVFDAADPTRRVHCVITPTDDAAPDAGGVAYLNSFGQGIPCWAFNPTEDSCAETISHEVGHTLGLIHDGTTEGIEYYGGHGTGVTSWAPIMGAYFADFNPPAVDEEFTQWSKGEYPLANNQEDDLQIITSDNGFGYERDDHGNEQASASPLQIKDGNVSHSGIIERSSDTDWFSFTTSGGQVTLNVNATDVNSPDLPQRGTNLAVAIELYDSQGTMVASSNPEDRIDASISQNLEPGDYFLKVDGAGRGSLETGFSDYASIGQFSVSGSVPQTILIVIDPPTREVDRLGGENTFKVSSGVDWSWSCDADWVASREAVNQSGNQVFEYTVARNDAEGERTAVIRLTTPGSSSTHVITQSGALPDDHGDDIETATLVAQDSSTAGVLEEEGDIDVFRIEVTGFGNLTVSATGSTDTFGRLHDFEGTPIASNDNARSPGFAITRPVSTGVYFVSVRHSVESGTGPYQLLASFSPGSGLAMDPPSRTVGAEGASFPLMVTSNTSWTWSSNASWVTSRLPANQSGGQNLVYQVAPNPTNKSRSARITLRYGTQSLIHQITQNAASSDDHGNLPSRATRIAVNGSAAGRIEAEGDVDLFRIALQTSGELSVATTGSIDSFGELLDSRGRVVASNDDAVGDNFGIVHAVGAGVYFVRVRHFDQRGLGAYRLLTGFNPSSLVDLRYRRTEGGSIAGPATQKVPLGGTGRTVRAVPRAGYSFLSWSDGLRTPVRTDANLRTHIDVSARFVPTLSARIVGGRPVANNQTPPVDFGVVNRNQAKRMSFQFRNNGSQTLRNLRVLKAGPQADAWASSRLSRTTLKPGQTAQLTVTLKSSSDGFKAATFTVAPAGVSRFSLRVMGVVGATVTSPRPQPMGKHSAPTQVPAQSPALKPAVPASNPTSTGLSQWLAISPDGFFHHTFQRARSDRSEPSFWISSDGITWEEALILDIWRSARGATHDKFEALIAPPAKPQPVILVSDTPPKPTKP